MKITIPVEKARSRAHYVLFAENTPFKQKRVELKTRYQRQPKHRKQDQ